MLFEKKVFMYRRLGWPGVLPKFWAIHAIALCSTKEKHGLLAALYVTWNYLFVWKEYRYEIWKRLLSYAVVVGVGIWAFPVVKPYAHVLTDGIHWQIPRLPFDLPAWTPSDPKRLFFNYGWVLVVLFLLLRARAVIYGAIGLSVFVTEFTLTLGWIYALVLGGLDTPYQTTTEYFWFGKFLPCVMPLQTFMWDWGLVVAYCVVVTIIGWLKNLPKKSVAQSGEEDATSGTFGKMREATGADLEKGGLF